MRFSISVPVGSWHPFLPNCLESLAAQNVDLEVALFDASGDPRVEKLADEYAELLTHRHHGPDKGQADAIARGWQATSGSIIGWLNADDHLFPDALEKVRHRLEADDAPDVVYGHSTIIDAEGRFTGYQYGVEPPSERLSFAAPISQPSCFFKRETAAAAGGLDSARHFTMDWDLFLRIHDTGARFAFLDEPLSGILWGDGTKTSTLSRTRREEIKSIVSTRQNGPSYRSVIRGFALQNLIDNSPPAVSAGLKRMLIRGRRTIQGLAGDGQISPATRLSLCRYDAPVRETIIVKFRKDPRLLGVKVNGADATYKLHGSSIEVQSTSGNFEPGTQWDIDLQFPEDHRNHLVHAFFSQLA